MSKRRKNKQNIWKLIFEIAIIICIIIGGYITSNIENTNETNHIENVIQNENKIIDLSTIPEYASSPYVELNNNIPSAENANKKNLITGTRYLNTEGMLHFENLVAEYINANKNNHVLYRVTPIFEGDNNIVNNFLNDLTENKLVQNFINELSKYLENNIGKEGKEMPIIEDILSKNNVTTGNENSIRWKCNDVILEYAGQNFSNNSMYFVQDSKKTYWSNNEQHYNNNVYSVLNIQNNKIEEIEISKNDMPQNIDVNDVFTLKDGKYVVDKLATEELREKITNMAKEIIDKQNVKLDSYRKEGHLYMVSEELGNNRFLWDLTDAPNFEFEEVNIPKDLLDKATQGSVLKYTNGNYEYYSNDGFERAEIIHSSK